MKDKKNESEDIITHTLGAGGKTVYRGETRVFGRREFEHATLMSDVPKS